MCSWFGHLDLFLYAFVVPILPYMLQERIGLGHDKAQAVTSNLLALYSLSQVVSSPVVGVIADRIPERKMPMVVALVFGLGSTALMAVTTSSEALVIGCSYYHVFS